MGGSIHHHSCDPVLQVPGTMGTVGLELFTQRGDSSFDVGGKVYISSQFFGKAGKTCTQDDGR